MAWDAWSFFECLFYEVPSCLQTSTWLSVFNVAEGSAPLGYGWSTVDDIRGDVESVEQRSLGVRFGGGDRRTWVMSLDFRTR